MTLFIVSLLFSESWQFSVVPNIKVWFWQFIVSAPRQLYHFLTSKHHCLKGGIHGSAHVHKSKHFFLRFLTNAIG